MTQLNHAELLSYLKYIGVGVEEAISLNSLDESALWAMIRLKLDSLAGVPIGDCTARVGEEHCKSLNTFDPSETRGLCQVMLQRPNISVPLQDKISGAIGIRSMEGTVEPGKVKYCQMKATSR